MFDTLSNNYWFCMRKLIRMFAKLLPQTSSILYDSGIYRLLFLLCSTNARYRLRFSHLATHDVMHICFFLNTVIKITVAVSKNCTVLSIFFSFWPVNKIWFPEIAFFQGIASCLNILVVNLKGLADAFLPEFSMKGYFMLSGFSLHLPFSVQNVWVIFHGVNL